MPSKRRRRIWYAVLGVLVAAGLALAFLFGRPVETVEAATVESGTFERYVEEDGRARVRERFVVSAPIDGTIERTALENGDAVERGDLLAVLRAVPATLRDPRTLAELGERRGSAEAALDRAKAMARRAETARAHAEDELERARSLLAAGVAPATEVEHAELDLELATRERDEARAQVHAAEHDLELAKAASAASHPGGVEAIEITAPVDGVLLQIHHESEGPVGVGSPLFELADPRAIEVVVDLLSTDAVLVDPGNSAEITRWGAGDNLAARVRRVSPRAVVKVSALGVEEERVDVVLDPLEVTPAWRRVGDGYRVDVRIPVEHIEDALVIPTSALFREEGRWCTFVIVGDRVHQRVVEVRSRGPLEAAVAAGLSDGEQVVVRPSESLADRARVRIAAEAVATRERG